MHDFLVSLYKLLPRKFTQTDAVINKIGSFKELHAPSVKKGERKYEKILEEYVNSTVARWEFGSGTFIKLLDDQDQVLPIVLKVPNPYDPDEIHNVKAAHQKYVELFGPEYVEDMTLIRITHPKLVAALADKYRKYPGQESPKEIKGFVQDLRGREWHEDIFSYVIKNHETMSPAMREKIFDLLNKIKKAIDRGFVLDFMAFPDRKEHREGFARRNSLTNILVDEEGPSIIDSAEIGTTKDPIYGQKVMVSITVAQKLLRNEINLELAYDEMSLDES